MAGVVGARVRGGKVDFWDPGGFFIMIASKKAEAFVRAHLDGGLF